MTEELFEEDKKLLAIYVEHLNEKAKELAEELEETFGFWLCNNEYLMIALADISYNDEDGEAERIDIYYEDFCAEIDPKYNKTNNTIRELIKTKYSELLECLCFDVYINHEKLDMN